MYIAIFVYGLSSSPGAMMSIMGGKFLCQLVPGCKNSIRQNGLLSHIIPGKDWPMMLGILAFPGLRL